MRYYLLVVLITYSNVFAQKKYWVYFKDDVGSIQDRIQLIEKNGGVYKRKSEWLNAASFVLTNGQIEQLKAKKLSKEIKPVLTLVGQRFSEKEFEINEQIEQIDGKLLIESGLTGKGIKVGIIDAGFSYANSSVYFKHLFSNGLVKAHRDFVSPDSLDFFKPKTHSDNHGASVWELIGGKQDNNYYGLAYESEFYLARTEIGDKEERIEEDKWIEAIEWMHKNGVKVVNSSVGYANAFDNVSDNHKKNEMDGKTTAISKAAQLATEEKGMLLVISAGNLGNSLWKIVSAPADAEGVISVGATDKNLWTKASYSSIGPSTNNYLKPNVSSYSPNGTSFSSPVIAGFAACLWQKDTSLTNKDLKKIIEQSSHLYPYGNNYIGYGVPNAKKAIAIIEKDLKIMMDRPKLISVENKKLTLNILSEDKISIVGFHKLNKHIVKNQFSVIYEEVKKKVKKKNAKVKMIISNKGDSVFLKLENKSKDVKYSSFSINNNDLYEIEWKKK